MTTLVIRGLAPVREVLSNGAVVIVKGSHTMPAVTINAAVRAGSGYDPDDCLGLANFIARVIDRGTERRTADDVAEALDGRGVSLSLSVTRHLLTVACTCLAEDFESILELVADIIRRPTFAEEEIAKRRGEIITSIRQDEDSPAVRAVESLMALLYENGHPYGRKAKGTVESVTRIDRGSLMKFHQTRFVPPSLSLAVVGDVDALGAAATASRLFGDWEGQPADGPALPRVAPADVRRQLVIPMMNKAQADIAYGVVTISRHDPAYYAYWVMNNIFGQYGLGGRLGERIRERQGMAYYVFSSLDANVVEGPLVIRAGVNPGNVDRAIASIDEEVDRLAAEGVTDRELAEAKQYLIGSLPRMLETNAGIATFLQTAEHFGLGLDYDQRLPELLGAVTRDAVHEAARKALSSARASVVVAGPCEPGRST